MASISVKHFATTTSGGAGTAMERISQSIDENCCVESNIRILFESKYSKGYLRYVANHLPVLFKLLAGRLDRKFTPTWLPIVRDHFTADIIHLHWISGYLSPSDIDNIDSPIVWTLHDMWPITGGCHYAKGCGKFSQQCGSCPALNSSLEQDISHTQFDSYKNSLAEKHTHFVTPSSWMSRKAKESSLVETEVSTIPYPIDSNIFTEHSKVDARKSLSIPTEADVILAGAVNMNKNHRKGPDLLIDALNYLPNVMDISNTIILQFGGGPISKIPIESRSLGWVSPDNLSLVYSSADVMIVPSRFDTFVQTAAEASACGTPVVAFDTSGIRDVVLDKETGLLADCYDTQELAENLADILTDLDKAETLGNYGRERAVELWSPDSVARKYYNIYEELV